MSILGAALLIQFGVDPLKLTLFSMAINAAVLPFVAIPFLLLMNDRKLLGRHANGWLSNAMAVLTLVVSVVLAVVSVPLMILGA